MGKIAGRRVIPYQEVLNEVFGKGMGEEPHDAYSAYRSIASA